MSKIKDIVRQLLIFFHLDLTKNLEYDRYTKIIMKRVIKSNSNCIDVGCHKGEMLDDILKLAPEGKHFGFEPIPKYYNHLKTKYDSRATILPYALSKENGESTFQFVKNAPAYSGIKKRSYNVDKPDIEEISVELKKLDDVIPEATIIDFIKIDVEGAEFDVLKGGEELLKKNKPYLIFECGLGASEFYNTKPEEIYDFITQNLNLKLSILKVFIKNEPSLTKQEFVSVYQKGEEYYFVAGDY